MELLPVPFDPCADTQARKHLGENRDSIEDTSLTMKLLNLIQQAPAHLQNLNSDTFSWLNPQDFGVPFVSPVPHPLDQGLAPRCVVFSIKALISFHMEFLSRLHIQGDEAHPQAIAPIPGVSLPFLGAIFENLKEGDQNMDVVLTRIHNDGFVADGTPQNPQALDDAPRFYIHWCLGFSRSGYQRVTDFNIAMKESILWYGGVLVELYMTDEFDPDGQKVVTMRGNLEQEVVNVNGVEVVRPSGHAVLVIGWRRYGKLDGVSVSEFAWTRLRTRRSELVPK